MVDEVKDAPQSASPEANRILADALKMPMVSNYKTVVKDLKAPELPKREAIVPEKTPALPAGKEYLAQMKPSLEAIKVAEQGELERQADLKLLDAQMEGDKYKRLSESAAKQKQDILADPARADYRRALEDKAKPFIPHEENAQDLMMLFGLLNVVGFAIGSGGKEYSQAAMSAMNGMLEGHQKGRDDLYKKEKSIFETNQKQLDSRIKQLLAFMQDNELLTGMDKTARDQAIEGEFLRNKADTLKEFYKKRGYGPTVEYLKSVSQAMDKAIAADMEENKRAAREDFDLRKMKAQYEGDRQKDEDNFTRQISLKQQELQQKALEAHEAKDFELQRDVQNRSFTLQAKLADFAHGEYLAKLNRDHADTIELARRAEAAGDRKLTAEYRERQQKIEEDRLEETKRHDKKREQIESARLNAEKQRTDTYVDPATGTVYQYDANKRSWIPAPGLPTGVQKTGGGGGRGSQTQQQFENITSADIGNAYFRINEYLSSSKDGKIPEGSKFLRDKGTQSGIIDAYKNYAINGMMPADLQKNDATLLGIAFDVVAARAFGRASGVTDSKIAQVVRQLPVEGDNEATKQTKMRILLNQLEEPNKLLPETKRKDGAEYMKSPVARGLYRTYAEKAEAEVETGKDEKGSFHYEYNEDKTKRRKVYD